MDRHGKRRSGTIQDAILPVQPDFITVQWLDHQNSLVVINNRHKQKMAHALLRMVRPGISASELDEYAEFTFGAVDVDSLVEDKTGVTIPAKMGMRNEMEMEILYKFDHYKLRFIRQKATLQDSKGSPILSLSSTELDKMLKKQGGPLQ